MTAASMRSVHVAGIGRVETVSRPRPAPGPDEVVVAMTYAGICGSDTHAVAGRHPLLTPPYFPGHEATGRICELGAGVSGWELGQRVILKPNVSCGDCVNCRAGRTNACQTLSWIGCDSSGRRPGAMAEFFAAPAANLLAVPDGVSDQAAALVECLSTPVHAVRIAGEMAGSRVVVIGGGTIGLFTVIAARRAGAGRIVMTDLDPAKLARGLRHGADATADAAGPGAAERARAAVGGPCDIVFDCVASQGSTGQAFELLRHAGKLMVVGVPAGPLELPMPWIQDWELTVQGCANYTAEDVEAAIAIAAGGGLPAGEVVSAVRRLEDASAAFAEAARNNSGKVLIQP
ncbi:MAG: alcohol dehydrogenase catalytic domain-containing protein [Bifidobacteriaceae bacterium]|jgi:threonine dehydrogenase-like Zn-dependent dehydrogenase|nr:alcohol dehydrogenase catalytic domain-containing protein [Bifidobacteriaceae bacterium]